MNDEFRFSKGPTPSIGISGHSEAKRLGDMNAHLTKWLRENETGYKEVSFGYQNFGKKPKKNDEQ